MEKIALKIGDKIRYLDNHNGVIDRIRIISSGKFVEQYEGDINKVVLTLKDKIGVINIWPKKTPVCLAEAKEHKKQK